MELLMNSTKGPCQVLPANDNIIWTQGMSSCDTIVIMTSRHGDVYQNVRGNHAGGGLMNSEFNSLFDGVPNNPNTMIYLFIGPENCSAFWRSKLADFFNDTLLAYNLVNCTVIWNFNVTEFRMNRNGHILQIGRDNRVDS